jgi:hypothetical protein
MYPSIWVYPQPLKPYPPTHWHLTPLSLHIDDNYDDNYDNGDNHDDNGDNCDDNDDNYDDNGDNHEGNYSISVC